MQSMKQLGGGLALGLLSAVIVIGAILLALAEVVTRKPVLVFPTDSPTELSIPFEASATRSLDSLLTPFPSGTLRTPDTAFPVASAIIAPNTITPSASAIACGAPASWVQYTIQPNDNLYQISLLYRTTVSDLQKANCLGSSTLINSGERLWVPNAATSTPPSTIIVIDFASSTLAPSATPTATNTGTSTPTATTSPTATSTPTATPTATIPPPAPP